MLSDILRNLVFTNLVVRAQVIKSMKSVPSLVICGFNFLGILVQEVELVREVDLVQEVDLDLVVRGDSHLATILIRALEMHKLLLLVTA